MSKNNSVKWYSGKTKAKLDFELSEPGVNYNTIMGDLIDQSKGPVSEYVIQHFFEYYRKFYNEIMLLINAREYKDDVCFNTKLSLYVYGFSREFGSYYSQRPSYSNFKNRGYSSAVFEEIINTNGFINVGFTIRRVKVAREMSEAAKAAKAELDRLDKEACAKVARKHAEIETKEIGELINRVFQKFCGDVGEEKAETMTIKEFMAEHLEGFMVALSSSVVEEKGKILEKCLLDSCAAGAMADGCKAELDLLSAEFGMAEDCKSACNENMRLREIIESEEQDPAGYRYVMQICFSTRDKGAPIAPYKPIVDLVMDDLAARGFTVSNKAPSVEVKACGFKHNHEQCEYWGVSSDDNKGAVLSMYVDL